MKKTYDLIIIGGGIVGVTLALILANEGMQVVLVEASGIDDLKKKSESHRSIVLAYSSRVILQTAQIWDYIAADAVPVTSIHVSDRGQFGTVKIRAIDENLPALGYVLAAEKINLILESLLMANTNIEVIRPGKFLSYIQNDDGLKVVIERGGKTEELFGELLIAADGEYSTVRDFLNTPVTLRDYKQSAIVCNIQLKRSHHQIAYERFTCQGPLAMLPLMSNEVALIWTAQPSYVSHLLTMSEVNFLAELQKEFGYRLGKLQACGERRAISLKQVVAEKQVYPGVVLLGNAAHTLHPVTGQGLNLALRGVSDLAEEIHYSKKNALRFSESNLLERYLSKRQKDQREMIALTNSLNSTFSTSLLPIVMARNMGLILLDRVNLLKKHLTKRTLGFSGNVPRLACGLPLD